MWSKSTPSSLLRIVRRDPTNVQVMTCSTGDSVIMSMMTFVMCFLCYVVRVVCSPPGVGMVTACPCEGDDRRIFTLLI
jgi:hypothetical protein